MKSFFKIALFNVSLFMIVASPVSAAQLSEEAQKAVDSWKATQAEYQAVLAEYQGLKEETEECCRTGMAPYGLDYDTAEEWMRQEAWAGCTDLLGITDTVLQTQIDASTLQIEVKRLGYVAAAIAMQDCEDTDIEAEASCMEDAGFNWDAMSDSDLSSRGYTSPSDTTPEASGSDVTGAGAGSDSALEVAITSPTEINPACMINTLIN